LVGDQEQIWTSPSFLILVSDSGSQRSRIKKTRNAYEMTYRWPYLGQTVVQWPWAITAGTQGSNASSIESSRVESSAVFKRAEGECEDADDRDHL
jgi:hypothetical protein